MREQRRRTLRRGGEIVRLDQSLGSKWGLDWKPASNEWPAAPPLLRRALHAFYARVRIRRLGGRVHGPTLRCEQTRDLYLGFIGELFAEIVVAVILA